jgi:hypothetical protein
MPKKSEVYVARQAFSPDGRSIVRRGTRVLSSDAIYKANRGYFHAADSDLRDNDIEQATAAPGEKRNAPTKDELLKAAKTVGAEVSKSDTKAEISEAIAESVEG